jgi:hypothetical protein
MNFTIYFSFKAKANLQLPAESLNLGSSGTNKAKSLRRRKIVEECELLQQRDNEQQARENQDEPASTQNPNYPTGANRLTLANDLEVQEAPYVSEEEVFSGLITFLGFKKKINLARKNKDRLDLHEIHSFT